MHRPQWISRRSTVDCRELSRLQHSSCIMPQRNYIPSWRQPKLWPDTALYREIQRRFHSRTIPLVYPAWLVVWFTLSSLSIWRSTGHVLIGEIRVMFAQEDIYSGYMDRYFAANPNPAISWIHDLGRERYGCTAAALLFEAKNATNLETRHVSPLWI